jgi:NAD(P)-dependent dehydrogenase (short-subunit alcohol dehydrogenase family)
VTEVGKSCTFLGSGAGRTIGARATRRLAAEESLALIADLTNRQVVDTTAGDLEAQSCRPAPPGQ